MNNNRLELSSSVRQVMADLKSEEPVSAATFVQAIFKLHGEYAEQRAGSLHIEGTSLRRKSSEWLDDVQTLFDPERVRSLNRTDKPAVLHGRLVVIGLSLLEKRLREQLEHVGAFSALVKELHEPLPEILTKRGRDLYAPSTDAKKSPDLLDTVPPWSDDPLLQPDQDLLGRVAFARFLARRIPPIEQEPYAYCIHLYGPWGAGKSTLLNFLRLQLERPKEPPQPFLTKARKLLRSIFRRKKKTADWLVVEFNAWRHQQIRPPWWSLLERIFQEAKSRLSLRERFLEYWWRFNSGRLQYFLGAIVLAWLLALVVFPLLRSGATGGGLKAFADGAENVSKILALIATVWGGIFAVNRSLLFGSAQAAQNYTELTHDPTNQIKRRFNTLIRRLKPGRVVILIDDLDRCQSLYVVDLLEGIQTLFREAPVVFVVAADRNWLNACYEEVYEKLEPRIHEPGKSLGALFLEKAFRFSTPMPGIPEELKKHYWLHLLRVTEAQRKTDLTEARTKAKDLLTNAQSESEIRRLVETSGQRSFPEQRALREEAAVKLAAPEIIERIEHTLKPYATLLEPNPRGMKLLVNGYSANRALAILAEVEIELDQLALWTILNSRWPQLADYLSDHPDILEKAGQEGLKELPVGLQELWKDPGVVEVLTGNSTRAALTKKTLRQSVQMRA